ncbi:MAG: peptidase and in kexin sedolisin [Gemmatimonadetes bacterium]|jgi:subtilisin family serine protease|nr:peptidase and in kexin sedolisin [Gemmatimonadota bacterium]
MKRVIAPTLALLALAACADSSTAPSSAAPERLRLTAEAPYFSKGASGLQDEYIVVFKDDVAEPLAKASDKIAKHAAKTKFKYGAALKGFAATLSPGAVAALRADPDVAYIEQDGVMTTTATQSGATWGIDRIDQRAQPLSGTYTYTSTGAGVVAYIIDTGIETSHPQFGGRAAVSYDALGGNGQDCNGHGTHVAGTVGSSTYGVAKGVTLRAVRVLDCNGSGSNSGVIAGMNWVASNHAASSVANMSLGGGYSAATNTAANNLASSGVFLAVAAGNSNADACNSSPSSAANTTTVGASTSTDARATYSNYGGCVDLYAPGSSITSTWLNGGTNTISGTSMATPHVTGVGALYKATYGNASYSTIRSWLTTNATANVITGNVSGTPNRLLYKAGL